MKTLKPSSIDPAVMAEISHAMDNAIKGIRDPEAMRLAAQRMDRMREEMKEQTGEVDLAVPLLQESRDDS